MVSESVELTEQERSLLLRAAVAAGHSVRTDLTYAKCVVIDGGRFWNPLYDDADAFELGAEHDLFAAPEFSHYQAVSLLKGCADKRRRVRWALVLMMAARNLSL